MKVEITDLPEFLAGPLSVVPGRSPIKSYEGVLLEIWPDGSTRATGTTGIGSWSVGTIVVTATRGSPDGKAAWAAVVSTWLARQVGTVVMSPAGERRLHVDIMSANRSATLTCMDPSDFPAPAVAPDGGEAVDDLLQALHAVAPAVSLDRSRPGMCGIYLERDRVTATSSTQLHSVKCNASPIPMIVPPEIGSALRSAEAAIRIGPPVDRINGHLSSGEITCRFPLVDPSTFPPWRSILDLYGKDPVASAVVQADLLADQADWAATIATRAKPIAILNIEPAGGVAVSLDESGIDAHNGRGWIQAVEIIGSGSACHPPDQIITTVRSAAKCGKSLRIQIVKNMTWFEAGNFVGAVSAISK